MVEISGRCLCGATKWVSAGPVLWAGHCHCTSCRRATSAPFTSFFGVPRARVAWHGDLFDHRSSNGAVVRKFCPSCGTQMTYQSVAWPKETHLYAATMDDPTFFIPEAHFHYSERLPWVQVSDNLPKYPGSADKTEPL